jgi:hypothetical protein
MRRTLQTTEAALTGAWRLPMAAARAAPPAALRSQVRARRYSFLRGMGL